MLGDRNDEAGKMASNKLIATMLIGKLNSIITGLPQGEHIKLS